MSYFEDDKKGQRNQAFPRPLYYYPLSFACLCDISCDTCLENIGDMGGCTFLLSVLTSPNHEKTA